MESKKLIHIFNICTLYLILEYTSINCKEQFTKEIFDDVNNIKSLNKNNDTFKFDSSIDPEVINIEVNIGKVQNVFLYNKNIYNFIFDLSNIENEILVHFYAMDCHIEIETDINDNIKINNISNYEYDSYYAIIKKGDEEDEEELKSNIIVKPLIYSLNENNKNRTYHLIINSFKNNSNTELILAEKEPTLLYFNNNLKEIKLLYELKEFDKNGIYPIVLSFFVKERVKFEVTISNDN